MLDSIGGIGGGLGGAGGIGGSDPGNSAASSAAADVKINPAIALGGVGGGYSTFGPFSVNFPGVQSQGSDSINAPNILSSVIPQGMILPIVALAGIIFLVIFLRK
jgi:hypothetical protein